MDFDALYTRYQCRELNKTQLAAAVGVYFNGLFSISVTCRKISPTTLLTNPYILTIINRDNYQRQLQGGNMTTENMKALLDNKSANIVLFRNNLRILLGI